MSARARKSTKKDAAKARKKTTASKKPVSSARKAAAPKAAKASAKKTVKKAASKKAPKVSASKKAPVRKKSSRRKASVATNRKRAARFRTILLARQRELTQAYQASKGDSRGELDSGTEDYIDYAVNSYAREFLLSLSELDRKQLLLVEDALRRIDRGEFGTCQQCGEEIVAKRLEVAPWVRHCIRCQELEEQGLLPQYTFAPDEELEEDLEEEELEEEAGEDETEDEEDEASDDEEAGGDDEKLVPPEDDLDDTLLGDDEEE